MKTAQFLGLLAAVRRSAALVLLALLCGCLQSPVHREQHGIVRADIEVQPCPDAGCQRERDEIYSLLAYAIVYKDWQTEAEFGTPAERGHNIGSVLVNPAGEVVFWARNCNAVTDDASQHGEVRLIRSFLVTQPALKYLDGYTIYTTLEPCAMCSGMMALTKVTRAVYGQVDPGYGRAIERLALDSARLTDPANPNFQGFKPYPRTFRSDLAATSTSQRLDEEYLKAGEADITRWLRTEAARTIYAKASDQLASYVPHHQANAAALEIARQLWTGVPDHYVPFKFDDP